MLAQTQTYIHIYTDITFPCSFLMLHVRKGAEPFLVVTVGLAMVSYLCLMLPTSFTSGIQTCSEQMGNSGGSIRQKMCLYQSFLSLEQHCYLTRSQFRMQQQKVQTSRYYVFFFPSASALPCMCTRAWSLIHPQTCTRSGKGKEEGSISTRYSPVAAVTSTSPPFSGL